MCHRPDHIACDWSLAAVHAGGSLALHDLCCILVQAAEGLEPPAGLVSAEGLETWAIRCFSFSSEMARAYPGLSLSLLCEYCVPRPDAADAEDAAPSAAPLTLALAQGLFQSCVALSTIASEEEEGLARVGAQAI